MSLVEGFRASSGRRQIIVMVVVVAVLCALFTAGYVFLLRKPYAVLFSNLRTADAATIVSELEKKKTPYRLESGGATILVPQDVVDTTRLAVMSEDLPLKGTVGFELFNKSDMGLTEFAQKINYQRALQGELARTIMTMDSIDAARVHLSLAEPSIFRDDRRPPKASVTLLPRPGKQITPDTVHGVQRLVAAAVPDLGVGDVVVLDEQGKVVSGDAGPVAPSQSTSLISAPAQEWRAIEDYYAARIRLALTKLYPNGDFTVTVAAQVGAVTPGGDSATTLDKWSPATRTFGLKAVVSPNAPPAPEVQAQIQSLAAAAIGQNAALGDTVTISTAGAPTVIPDGPPLAQGAIPRPQAVLPSPIHPEHGASPAAFWGLAIVLILLVLFILIVVVFGLRARRQASSSNGLTERQRGDYADRLRTLIDQEDAHAAPPI